MDEADGRPGFVAYQFGHLDVPANAPAESLCRDLFPNQKSGLRERTFRLNRRVVCRRCGQGKTQVLRFAQDDSQIQAFAPKRQGLKIMDSPLVAEKSRKDGARNCRGSLKNNVNFSINPTPALFSSAGQPKAVSPTAGGYNT